MSNKPFTYFSTFTGIGGFEIGIHNAHRATHGGGESGPEKSTGFWSRLFATARKGTRATQRLSGASTHDRIDQRPHCVGYSEIDKFAISVYEKHFEGVKNYGDITKINAEELPDFDCLVGGFPCQAFSIAGSRKGFADTRGTLFFDLARILQAKRPRLFVFENVKGLISHDGGRTFRTIIATLDELGYDLQWQVLNSKNFGVPQNRERIIIVGHTRGSTRPEVFPITGSNSNHIREITRAVPQAQRVYGEAGVAPSVDTGGGGNRQAKLLMEDWRIRKLTPLECERLQAFPDNWTQYGMGGVQLSDTQRYKMAGNAVTTNVIQAVFERIFATPDVV